jgi:hypothetical protein
VRRSINISLFIIALSAAASAQVIDTTKSINTWQLKHNFTRFEEVPLDTNMHQLQRGHQPAFEQGFAYEALGNLGHALNHIDFLRRPEADQFLFGRAWDPYRKTPERTLFFNTRSPFTSLAYSTNIAINQFPEQNIEAIHTQNLSPFANFGLVFNILDGKPLYKNQQTRVNRVGLFGSRAKDRYSIFGTFYYNNFESGENGGIDKLSGFLKDSLDAVFDYETKLSDSHSLYRDLSLFATQNFKLVEAVRTTDSLGNTTSTGKTLSISHQLLVERQSKKYFDKFVDSAEVADVYKNYYYLADPALDSAVEDRISNVFQLILGDPDFDKISARISAGHDFRRFAWLAPETQHIDSTNTDTIVGQFHQESFNDFHVGLHLAGPTTGTWDWVVDAKYYLLGYYQSDFQAHATFSRKLAGNLNLGLRGSFEQRKPHYFTNRYSSSFLRWENDFPSMLRIKGEAFITSKDQGTDVRVGLANITNYIYWDQEALPRLYDQNLMIFSGYFSKHFILSGFNSQNNVLVQYTTAQDVLRLPLLALYTSNYWKQSLFKGALVADLGFDLYYTSRYKASAYMPSSSVFHLQDKYDLGAFPFLDVFLAFRIKRTRIFVSYSNLLQGLSFVGNNYLTTAYYPMKPKNFRLGLTWIFYD